MPAKKPIPREVLEAKLKEIEDARARRRLFFVEFGVYAVLLLGVLASQVIVMADDLNVTFKPIEIGQVVGSMLVASMVYKKLEGSGDLKGKAQAKNFLRILLTAFNYGFTWMTIIGAWW